MTIPTTEKPFREPSPGFTELMGKWGQRDKETECSKPFFARIGRSMTSTTPSSSSNGGGKSGRVSMPTPAAATAHNSTTLHRASAPAVVVGAGGGGVADTTDTVATTTSTSTESITSPIREGKPVIRSIQNQPKILSPSELKKRALIDRSCLEVGNNVHNMTIPPPFLDSTVEEDDDEDDEKEEDEKTTTIQKSSNNSIQHQVKEEEEVGIGAATGRSSSSSSMKPIRKVSSQWTSLLRTSKQLVHIKHRIQQKKAKLHNVYAEKLNDDVAKTFIPPVFEKTAFEKQIIKGAMNNNFIFRKLDKFTINAVIDAFEEVTYQSNEIIIQQGTKGDYFYAIKHGQVDFYVDTIKVGTATAGHSFGELALLYTCPRAATVKASTSEESSSGESSSTSTTTKLFRIDHKCFRYILKDQRKKLKRQKIKLLRDTKKFHTIEGTDLKIIIAAMEPHIYEKDDILWSTTNTNTKDTSTTSTSTSTTTTFQPFCIIQEGELSFTNISIGGGKRHVKDKILKRGDYFGEISVNHMEPIEEGTVTALSRVLAFTIDPHVFDRDFGGLERLLKKANDKRHLSVMASVKNWDNLDDNSLNTLADHIVDITFEAGSPIFEKGQNVIPAIFLVREGKVRLDETKEEITTGGSFGQEMDKNKKNISHAKAEFTAIAVERTVCGVLSLPDCPVIFDQHMISKVAERYTPSCDLVLEDLTHHRVLGEGQFGEVFLVSSKKEKKPKGMALKTQSIGCTKRPDTVQAIWNEIKTMQHLKHDLLVSLITTFEDKEHIYMLLTVAHGGELWDIIHQETEDGDWVSGIGEQNGKFYAAVVADALAFMHRQKYVYRDLKPENVLIDEMGYPILTDFGFAKHIGDDKTFTFCGTPNYLPPEVISNSGHCFSADNWSLGVLIYELIEGENPFYYQGMDQMALYEAICSEQQYPLQKEVASEANEIIDLLLEKNPDKRLGMFRQKDILGHPWFSDLDFTKLRNREVDAPWVPDPLQL